MKNSLVVILIVVVIVASGGVGYATRNTFTITQTKSVQTSNTSAGDNGTAQLYQLEFVQESNCPNGSWFLPWAVILDNNTVIVQPSNTTLPLTYNESHLTFDSNFSTISFSVPNGSYDYTVTPKNFYGTEQSGNVTIASSNVVVPISAFILAMGCSSNTTTQ